MSFLENKVIQSILARVIVQISTTAVSNANFLSDFGPKNSQIGREAVVFVLVDRNLAKNGRPTCKNPLFVLDRRVFFFHNRASMVQRHLQTPSEPFFSVAIGFQPMFTHLFLTMIHVGQNCRRLTNNQSVTWYQYRTVQYRTVSKKYAQNSKIQGPVQYS